MVKDEATTIHNDQSIYCSTGMGEHAVSRFANRQCQQRKFLPSQPAFHNIGIYGSYGSRQHKQLPPILLHFSRDLPVWHLMSTVVIVYPLLCSHLPLVRIWMKNVGAIMMLLKYKAAVSSGWWFCNRLPLTIWSWWLRCLIFVGKIVAISSFTETRDLMRGSRLYYVNIYWNATKKEPGLLCTFGNSSSKDDPRWESTTEWQRGKFTTNLIVRCISHR